MRRAGGGSSHVCKSLQSRLWPFFNYFRPIKLVCTLVRTHLARQPCWPCSPRIRAFDDVGIYVTMQSTATHVLGEPMYACGLGSTTAFCGLSPTLVGLTWCWYGSVYLIVLTRQFVISAFTIQKPGATHKLGPLPTQNDKLHPGDHRP